MTDELQRAKNLASAAADPAAPPKDDSEAEVKVDLLPPRVRALLYLLMRDHLPAGTVIGVIKELEGTPEVAFSFTSKPLADLARELTERLRGVTL